MRIYISGALNGVPPEVRERYERFASILQKWNVEAYVPHLHTNHAGNADTIFSEDCAAISGACGVLAFLDEPGLGTGAEVMLSMSLGIPLMAAFQHGRSVSRFIIGALNAAKRDGASVDVVEYEDTDLTWLAILLCNFIGKHRAR